MEASQWKARDVDSTGNGNSQLKARDVDSKGNGNSNLRTAAISWHAATPPPSNRSPEERRRYDLGPVTGPVTGVNAELGF